jgi:hypothetical protein
MTSRPVRHGSDDLPMVVAGVAGASESYLSVTRHLRPSYRRLGIWKAYIHSSWPIALTGRPTLEHSNHSALKSKFKEANVSIALQVKRGARPKLVLSLRAMLSDAEALQRRMGFSVHFGPKISRS